jgi:hypothetical protein
LEYTERLTKEWNSPIYAFFSPLPTICYIDGRRVHVFECNAKPCKGKGRDPRCVNRYLDKKDAKSTGNLRKHARICWGEETVQACDDTKDVLAARVALRQHNRRDGTVLAAFERVGNLKKKPTYSNRQHTKTEVKYVLPMSD